jgi:nucleoside-diphosphate-sugar epimerase
LTRAASARSVELAVSRSLESGAAGRVLVLGCGFAGLAIARLAAARGLEVTVTSRSAGRREALRASGLRVLELDVLDESIGEHVDPATHVVIAHPPDGLTDARTAASLASTRAVTYLSSTGVYGERRGVIDDDTPLPERPTERAARILEAERLHREHGATVLRSPGIYGPERGLHRRVVSGVHRIPGDGSRYLSRIHVEDLAAFALGAARVRGETFVVGDACPAPHGEVVRWICETWGVPLPPSVPLEEVHETLRADRRIEASRARRLLGVELRFPTYRDGMSPDACGRPPSHE